MLDQAPTAGLRQRTDTCLAALATVVRGSRDPSLLLGADGAVILAANDACAERLACRVEDLVGRDWRTLFDPALARARYAKVRDAIDQRASVDFEDERSDRQIEHRVVPIVEADGAVRCVLYTARDVTERRARERASERERHKLRTLLDAFPGFVGLYAPDGATQEANLHALTETQRARSGSVAPLWEQPFAARTPGLGAAIVDAFARARGGDAVTFEAPIVFDDGRQRDVEVSIAPVTSAGGVIEHVAAFGVDRTERNRALAALRASEERYRLLFEEAGDAILLSDVQGRYFDVNERACGLLGRPREELTRLGARELMSPEDAAKAEAWMANVGEGARIAVATRLRHPARGWVPVELTATRLSDGNVLAIVRDVSERRRAEDSLRAQTARLVAAERIANLGTMELDLATGEAIWSEQAYRILEMPFEQSVGLYARFLARVHPDDRERIGEDLAQVIVTGRPMDRVFRLVMPDGRVKHARRRAERVEVEGEASCLRVLGTIEDITERVNAEHERRQRAQEYYRLHEAARLKDAAVDAALNGMALADLSGRLTYVNRSFLRLWRLTEPESALGRSLVGLWCEPDRANEVVCAIAQGADWSGELTARRDDGSTFVALLAATLLRDAEGHPTRFLASFIDVTERVRVESDLRTHSQVLYSMAEGVCFVDDTLTIRFANRAMHAMFGYEAGDLVGRSVTELDDATQAENDAFYSRMLAEIEHRGEWAGEFRNRRRDGTEFHTHARATFLRQGGRRWFVVVEEDITERKRAEQENQRALREKETLLREVHHRVKNNLQVICSLLSLQRGALVEERSRAVLQDCEDRVRNIAMIHEQLYQSTDLSTLDLGVHLCALVAKIGQGSPTPIRFVTRCNDTIHVGLDAAVPIGFVLHELVTNALKHAFPERPGLVRVTCRRSADTLFVVVRDDGVGLSPDWRSHNRTSLGLNLVEALAQQLDGTFEIRSDQGTLATLRVPLMRTQPMGAR